LADVIETNTLNTKIAEGYNYYLFLCLIVSKHVRSFSHINAILHLRKNKKLIFYEKCNQFTLSRNLEKLIPYYLLLRIANQNYIPRIIRKTF